MHRIRCCFCLACGLLLQSCAAYSDCQPQHPDAPANAGCFVVLDDKLLVVRDRKSGRLGFPGGTSVPPEPAQCTAVRETREETGLEVRAGSLLTILGSGFRLYRCALEARQELPTRPPYSALLEIVELQWVQPETVPASDWRFPEQLEQVRELYRRETARQ